MIEVISVTAVVISLAIVTWQTFLLRQQTEIAAEAAVTAAGNDVVAFLHSALGRLCDEPDLRRHFYNGVGRPDGLAGERVDVIAEMIADVVEIGLETAAQNPRADARLDGWKAYARHFLRQSPVVRNLVEAEPEWYPRITKLIEEGPR